MAHVITVFDLSFTAKDYGTHDDDDHNDDEDPGLPGRNDPHEVLRAHVY